MESGSRLDGFSYSLDRRRFLRDLGAFGLALSLPASLVACGGGGDGGSAEQLTWAHPAAPPNLDYVHAFDFTTPSVLSNSLEGLLAFDDAGALQPSLAESWSQPDPKTYVYKLRPDVTFWNGDPLTAEDVVFSLSQHIDPAVESPWSFYYATVDRIEATADDEVTVHMKTPDAFFQYIPAHGAARIVQKAFAEEHGENIGLPDVLTMGTGPYEVTEYVAGEKVAMARNESYWGDAPTVQELTHTFIPDDETRLLAMQSGEIDGAFFVPAQAAQRWDGLDGAGVTAAPSLWSVFYELDVADGPTSDIGVRRAISHATDREGLVNTVLAGHGRAATSIVAPEQWGVLLERSKVDELYATFPQYEFDLDKAEFELKNSKFPTFSVTSTYPSSFQSLGKALLSLAENLRPFGVEIDVQEVTQEQFFADIQAHKTGLHINLWFPDYPDPANYPAVAMHSQYAVKGGYNMANYKNPEVDELLDRQIASLDPAERAELTGEVLQHGARDLPYVPIWWEETIMAIGDDFVYDGFNAFTQFQRWGAAVQGA
jgi:peptide/nickel transport system substrate-binding protein